MARYLIGFLRVLAWPIDLIAPVPMGKARKAERGYNQAAFLALPLALGCRIPYQPKALIRSRQTRSQVGLTTEQRRVNVAGAFKANPDIVRDKTVLVVDDVATSGATMDACALALKDAGAAVVYGLALARASRDMQGYSGS
ncbi:ComF family protein [Chloroflexota bacterium]